MQTILIIGATGLLGSALSPYLKKLGIYKAILHGKTKNADVKSDLTQFKQTNNLLDQIQPDVIVNLAALTNVDECEADIHEAYRLNTCIVENIANWIKTSDSNCHLIQMSTDHVYDACKRETLSSERGSREEQIKLVNIYAFSKYAGELAATSIKSTVLRINFFGKSILDNRGSFTDWLYQALREKKKICVFNDVYFSPLSLVTLVEMIALVIEKRPIGIYNLGSRLGMSKAEFAIKFAREVDLDSSCLKPIKLMEYEILKTNRPKDMRMDSHKFEVMMGLILPSLESEIELVARSYRDASRSYFKN